MTARSDLPTVVVGGGPAGSAAAWHLARHGLPVVLLDKARFPRDKACGDGLTGGAVSELARMELTPDDLQNCKWVTRTNFVAPSGRSVVLETEGHRAQKWLGASARADFDRQLLDHARQAGAEIHEDTRVESIYETDGAVEVRTSNGNTISAGVVVAADGAWSSVRRSLEGQAAPLSKWQASRMYIEQVDGPGADQAYVWFAGDLLPGYAWSFPLGGGRVNLGVGALRETGGGGGWIVRRTDRLLEEVGASILGSNARSSGRAQVWPIPTDLKRGRLGSSGGRVLYVGDAAGSTDPMTGEGIAEALSTGRVAAAAVASGDPASYTKRAWAELGGRHRRRARCSRLLSSRFLAESGLRVADLSGWTRRQFTGWVFS